MAELAMLGFLLIAISSIIVVFHPPYRATTIYRDQGHTRVDARLIIRIPLRQPLRIKLISFSQFNSSLPRS
jgi:hypothetical protein